MVSVKCRTIGDHPHRPHTTRTPAVRAVLVAWTVGDCGRRRVRGITPTIWAKSLGEHRLATNRAGADRFREEDLELWNIRGRLQVRDVCGALSHALALFRLMRIVVEAPEAPQT